MLNPKLENWLAAKRLIEPETAHRLGIYSARRGPDGGMVPDVRGDVLVFPYFERGEEVNAKFRAPGKKFWQRTGARKTFFNSDVLDDPAVIAGSYPLVITEGEIDALSFIQAGYPLAVSVPDGAPPARDEQGNLIDVPETGDDVDPKEDEKYRYVFNNWERLKRVKRVVLATDGDEPGWRLSQELARRLGRSRCFFVRYPEGCKDANEVLVLHGPRAAMELVTRARPFPVRGLYKLSDFPDEPPIRTFSTGLPGLEFKVENPRDPHLLLYRGAFVVVSGIPGCGKTQVTTQIAFNMARLHGWRIGIASFEMRVSPTLRDMLRGFFIQKPRSAWSRAESAEADAFTQEYFSFICLQPQDEETEADIDWVIDRASDAVIRDGIDMLLLDPWNEVEHKRRAGESIADYTNRAIRSLKRYANSFDVCTVVVAHPTKSAGLAVKGGEEMSLYDISDGATWANKAELGLIISRKSHHDTVTEVGIRKVKFRGTGRIGEAYLQYDESVEAFVA
jgi:twinkle protein